MPEPRYDLITHDEEVDILCEIIDEMSAEQLITTVPNIYSELREHFNNDILDAWVEANPEKALTTDDEK